MRKLLQQRSGLFAGLLSGILLFGAQLLLQAQSIPAIAISANNSGDAQIFRGMPLLVTVTIMSPTVGSADAAPLVIAATQGAWTNSVRMEILDAMGVSQAWPFNTRITPGPTITLNNVQSAGISRWLTPEQTFNLSTGTYSLAATLDTIAATLNGAWKGVVEATPANLTILDEPATLTEAQAENKYSELARYDLFRGDVAGGLDRINTLLAGYPTNLGGLRLKAEALKTAGKMAEAFEITTRAIESFYGRKHVLAEPPTQLIKLQQEIEQSFTEPVLRFNAEPGEKMKLDWIGDASFAYRLESSADFQSWTELSANFTVNSDQYSVLAPAANERGFFRLSV